MKHFFTLLCVCTLAFMTSCNSDSREQISASTIVSLVEDMLEVNCENQDYAEITTGYFECNDKDKRYTLRKLAAAGVITYKTECFEVTETYRYSTGYDWWTGRQTYATGTRTNRHVFVDVALTSKGKSYVVDGYPVPDEDEDPDLAEPAPKAFPEDDVPYDEVLDCDKKEPKKEPKESTKSEEEYDPSGCDTDYDDVADDEPQDTPGTAELTPYEKACQKVYTEDYIVETGAIEIVKARNIRLDKIAGRAAAEIIIEVTDVSPFGRILQGLVEGERDAEDVTLIYFEDKGWILEDF